MQRSDSLIAVVMVFTAVAVGGCSTSAPPSYPPPIAPKTSDAWRAMIGSWQATSAQRTLVLSIHERGTALVLVMQPGQHTAKTVGCRAFGDGIIIDDVTRLRLRPGSNDQELRAEYEPVPDAAAAHRNDAFAGVFTMSRIARRDVPPALLNRRLPDPWMLEDR